MKDKIQWVLSHKNEAKAIGFRMQKRAQKCFSIMHLNDIFYDTIMEDVLYGKYDENKIDMTLYKVNSGRNEEKDNQ